MLLFSFRISVADFLNIFIMFQFFHIGIYCKFFKQLSHLSEILLSLLFAT